MSKHLIVMSGLPGSGKSTLAEKLAVALSFPVLSIDLIEAAMWRNGFAPDATGVVAYEVARALADELLKLGMSVIIDAVNLVEVARETWRTLAAEHEIEPVMIECVCSDAATHKRRIEKRVLNIPGMAEVTWQYVEQRRAEHQRRDDKHLTLDSSREGQYLLAVSQRYIQS